MFTEGAEYDECVSKPASDRQFERFPFKPMSAAEAMEIHRVCVDAVERSRDTIGIPLEYLHGYDAVAIAEAFAVIYRAKAPSDELLKHLREGIAWLSTATPGHILEAGENLRAHDEDTQKAYYQIVRHTQSANGALMEHWFEYRIGNCATFEL